MNYHTKLKTTLYALTIVFSCNITLASTNSEAWLRIDQPDQLISSQLTTKGIDYGSFIWVNENQTQGVDLGQAKRVSQYSKPFELTADGVRFDPVDSIPQDGNWFTDLSLTNDAFFLVQFAGPTKSEWLNELQALGITPLKAMAPFSYIVWANSQAIEQSQNLANVRWSGYFYNAFRVQTTNRQLDSTVIPTMALVYRPSKDQTLTNMQLVGASLISVRDINRDFVAVTFEVSGNLYQQLSSIAGVLTVQKIGQDAGPRGEMSQQAVVGNYDASNIIFPGYQTWLNNAGVDGSGVVVGIVDGGIFDTHPDLVDNMVACTGPGPSCSDTNNAHGTHVAGAVGGTAASGTMDSNGFLRGQGVAPGASIIEQRYIPLLGGGPGGMVAGGMLSIYKDSAISGAMLTNNSWGPTIAPQGYDIPTMEIDIISRDADPDTAGNQPVLAVWSIMNGNGDRPFGTCNPSSLASPDEAKNLFAIGSTKLQTSVGIQITEIFDVSENSAHGPACDGRQIPHVVAPGCRTDSPDSSTGYGLICGTSMASPIVSGSVALFWEQYRNAFATDPSPALVKATFSTVAMNLQGFDDADGNAMGNAPDRKQGWGRLDLDKVINPPQNVWYYDQQLTMTSTGQQWTQSLSADDPAEPVRLMLVWTDAAGPGLGGTNPAWVNDLDLSVDTLANSYLGNVFGGDAFSTTGGTADSINNMEGIFLRANQHNGNSFEITVTAANLTADALNPYTPTTPTQDFAIVCYNCSTSTVIIDSIFSNGFENTDIIFANGFEN